MEKYSKLISEEDIQLFHQTVGEIASLSHSKKLNLRKSPSGESVCKNSSHKLNKTQVPHIHDFELNDSIEYRFGGEDAVFFSRPGLSPKILRQLKRGKCQLDASIDLHGKTIDEARQSLIDFIQHCHHQNYRWLLVIHGKGLSSLQQKPILKNHVTAWLMQIPIVLAYSSATQQHGGTGAVAVLIKKQ